mmetsp:Transcript_18215/g.37475  ORF Transcript_18215/g.37475 Transcript_18215/m.37475 type:complete len:112 (+) Transcript_18215:992-1327(+)
MFLAPYFEYEAAFIFLVESLAGLQVKEGIRILDLVSIFVALGTMVCERLTDCLLDGSGFRHPRLPKRDEAMGTENGVAQPCIVSVEKSFPSKPQDIVDKPLLFVLPPLVPA